MHPIPSGRSGAPAQPLLTVASAARRLGVAPATLRTWDRRYGMGPSAHQPGRHRRYSAEDVARLDLMRHALLRGASAAEAARFARAARLPHGGLHAVPGTGPVPGGGGAGDAADQLLLGDPLLLLDDTGDGRAASRVRVGGRVLRLPGAGRVARGLGRAALALDAASVRRLLQESVDTIGIEATWDDVARPVLAAVAQRWADTGAGVEIEHLISDCVIGVFGMHVLGRPVRTVRPLLLAGMPLERHTLPLVALSAALAGRGVECRSLGGDLPVDALAAAIRRTAPAAVVLWSQAASTARADVVRGLPRTTPRYRTYVGGPGWAGVALPARVDVLTSLTGAVDELADAALAGEG